MNSFTKLNKIMLWVFAFGILSLSFVFNPSAFAITWTYYDKDNKAMANPTQDEVDQLAVMRASDTGITQYSLEISHDFSGTWGTGYLENIGNPTPGVGKTWKTKDEKVTCQVDGIVPDIYNINSRYIATTYKAKGSMNSGLFASAVQLDGVDDYISVSGIDLNNKGSFSVEFWAKRDALGRNECLFGQGTATEGKGIEFGYYDSENTPRVQLPGWAWARTNTPTDTGWHQWRIEYIKDRWPYGTTSGAGFHIKIYRDNQLINVSTGDIGDVGPACNTTRPCRTVNYSEVVCGQREEKYKDGCDEKTRTVPFCWWEPRSRQECWDVYNCTDRAYTGTGTFYIGRGISGANFKGQIKDIIVKAEGTIVGKWQLNDGNKSTTAVDRSGYNRTATLNNFDFNSCWVVDASIMKEYEFTPIQSLQVIPVFTMNAPSSIVYTWSKQMAVNVSTIPDTKGNKASLKITDISGQENQTGTGKFWYKLGTAMKLSSEPDDCMQLLGYRDNLGADPNKDIQSNEVIIKSLDGPVGITWVYSQYIYEETVTIGSPVTFSSVPMNIQQRAALTKKPTYKTDATNQTPEAEMFYWSAPESKLFPVKPEQTFQLEWNMAGECPGTKLITKVTTKWPDSPHYIHVAKTPPINLDASAEDLIAFKGVKYTTGDGAAAGNDFTAAQPGKTVLLFTRGDYVTNTNPKEISLTFNGKTGYADAGTISLNRGQFTIEFWAKRAAKDMLDPVIGQGAKQADKGLTIGFDADNTFMFSFFGNDLKTTTKYTDNDWHQWTCTYEAVTGGEDGECFQCINDPTNGLCRWTDNTCYTKNFTGKSVYENGDWKWNSYYYANRCSKQTKVMYKRVIYRDGIKVAEDTTENPYKGTGDFRIGSTGEGWNPGAIFNGQIDEVRVWDIAKTVQTIVEDKDARLVGNEEGLIGYWRFDNNRGSYVEDSRVLTTPDTLDDQEPAVQPVLTRTTLSFNGTDNYLLMNNPFSDGKNFTIELWVYPELIDKNYHGIIGWQETADSNRRSPSLFIAPDGGLLWHAYDAAGNSYADTLPGFFRWGKWVHLAWVKNGTTFSFYKNGVLVKTATAPTAVKSYSRYAVGKIDQYLLQGKLDEIRIWNAARTEADIVTNMNTALTGKETGLAAYFPIDKSLTSDSTTLLDRTANKKNGTLVNIDPRSDWVVSEAPSVVLPEKSLSFDGIDDYAAASFTYSDYVVNVDGKSTYADFPFNSDYLRSTAPDYALNLTGGYADAPNHSSLHMTSGFTVEAWINLSNPNADQKLIGKTDTSSGYVIGVQSGKLYPEVWANVSTYKEVKVGCDTRGTWENSTVRYTFQAGSIPANTWTHIAVTYAKGGNMIGYINGTEVGRVAVSPNDILTNGNPLRIGAGPWNASLYKVSGQLDEIRVWNGARSQADIQGNMNKTLAGNEGGLSAYYNCNEGSGTQLKDVRGVNNAGIAGSYSYILRNSPITALTLEAMVNLADPNADQKIIGQKGTSGFIMGVSGGKLYPEIWDADGTRLFFQNGTVPANTWTHLAITWQKDGSLIGYINGVEAGRIAGGAKALNNITGPLRVGASPSDPSLNKVKGQIEEVRVWKIARSAADIQSTMSKALGGKESGLVAYYNFNQGAGTAVVDAKGANGTILNGSTASWSPRANTLDITSAITVEAWVNLKDPTKDQKIVGKYASDRGYLLGVANGLFYPQIGDDFGTVTTFQKGTVPANTWTHLAMTWQKGDNLIGYVNGVEVSRVAAGSAEIGEALSALVIGAAPWDTKSGKTNGQIDEVRIWNIVRSAADIQASMNKPLEGAEANLKIYYNFNEAAGTTLINRTLKGNDAAIVNSSPVWMVGAIPPTIPASVLSSALNFDGVNHSVDVGNWFNYQTFTISMWVKPGAKQVQYADIIDNNHTADRSWVLQQDSNTTNRYYWGQKGMSGVISFNLNADQWQHLAITFDGTNIKGYLNGISVGSATGTAITYDGSQFLRIGRWGGGGRNWNGQMDELSIWNKALAQADIKAMMFKPLAGTETGLAAYYNFDNRQITDMLAKVDVLNFGVTSGFYSKSVYPFVSKTYMALGGGTSYMEIPDSTSLNLTSALTLEAWIYLDSVTDAKIINKCDPTAKKGYALGVTKDGVLLADVWDGAGAQSTLSGGKVSPTEWMHVAFTWKKGDKLITYINGFKVAETAAGVNDLAITNNPLRIGAAAWDPKTFVMQGKIDEVRVWNVARSQNDLKNSMATLLTGKESGLVAYYNFDGIQDTRLPDLTAYNNKGVIVGATFIQEGLSDNMVAHPVTLVDMVPSDCWTVNTSKVYALTPDAVADSGIACVRVVETIPAEGNQTLTGTATVGTELTSSYHGKDVPHNGYLFREIGPYNINIYDRPSKIGAIYPVNTFHPSVDPKEDRLLVIWYRMQDNIDWPYQPVDYTVGWPGKSNRIVVASRVGSEGKDKDGNTQTYVDADEKPQNYIDPRRYRDVKVYNQPDKTKPGYNPNEEHGLIAPSFRHSQMSPQPVAAFALRNDLNKQDETKSDFTSKPFVLVQYYDNVLEKHGMAALAVEIEDSKCGYTFNYDMKAGEPVVAPYPVNTVIGAAPPSEIFGKNGNPAQKCYWEDHKGQPWVISGAGKTVQLSGITEKSSTEYILTLDSESFVQNEYYLVKVIDDTGPVGAYKFVVGDAIGDRDNAPVLVKNYSVAGTDKTVTVTLNPGITGLVKSNFELYHYTTTAHVLSYFWYPPDPTFWIDEQTPGDGTGDSGKSYPFLPVGVVATTDGFPTDMTGKAKAREIRYDTTWPDDVAILKAGETLTFPGGEYKADNQDANGLPGVLSWAAGQVVFDELNPTMDETKLFTNYQVRLGQVLEERSVDLKIEDFPEDFKPAAKRVDVIMNRYYFKDLHAGLKNRICYDPMSEKLIMKGFLNSKTLGDKTLTAAPPAIYALQPNIMTATERDTIKKLEGVNTYFTAAVDSLFNLTKNPKQFTGKDYAVGIDTIKNFMAGFDGKTAILNRMKQFFAVWLGVNVNVDDLTKVPARYYPEISFGPGLALMPNGALLDPANEPFKSFNEGFITLAENNHPELGGMPVALHIVKVKKDKYRGAIKTVFSDNVFDEKISMRHTADFGGKATDLVFQWQYREDDGTTQPIPSTTPEKWKAFPDPTGNNGLGMSEITLAGAGSALLVDNLFYVRYRHKSSPENVAASWSEWAGAANSRPPKDGEDPMDTYQAQLCEGWIKRVLFAVNPFEARIRNFYNSDSPATYVSMIQQAGQRFEGPVAFNPDKDVIENVGLIELYQTVLERGKSLSINLSQPVCTPGVTSALMLAASRISGFYTLLGNEAYTDAQDPTIGFGSSSVEYGSLAPTIFAFTNQVASLLDEEMALLRGRSESGARPVYNRLMWNFTKDRGEAAYAMNYSITDTNKDGFINDADGQAMYPQGHGDAWGHYLTAVTTYYDLLRHKDFIWESRPEKMQIQGVVMDVDYFDERKFAEAAAAKAKAGKEIVDLTYRSKYVDDPQGQWQGYEDTDKTRAWGVSEWARRAALGAYFDWASVNAILPSAAAFRLNRSDLDRLYAEKIALDVYNKLNKFEDQGYNTQDEMTAALTAAGIDATPYPNILKYAEKTGLKRIDRTTVKETLEIASQGRNIQKQADDVNTGLNPLGLANTVVPFDIDPSRMVPGAVNPATQFEQVYERAVSAMENARVIFDYANDLKNRIRQAASSTQEFSDQVDQQDRDYRNRLIETFGTPYEGTVGSGKVFPAGYEGPDYFLYNYIDVNEVSDKTVPPPNEKFSTYFTPLNTKFAKEDDRHFFPQDLKEEDYTSMDSSGILQIDFPKSASKYSYQAPAEWGMRKSPGEIQQALIELVKSEADLQLALSDYSSLIAELDAQMKLLDAKSDLRAELVRISNDWKGKVIGFNTASLVLKTTASTFNLVAELVDDEFSAFAEGLPTVLGLANDATAPARGALQGTGGALKNGFQIAGQVASVAADAIDNAKEITELDKDAQIDTANYKYEIQEQLKEIQTVMGNEASTRLKIFRVKEDMRQASEKYRSVLAKGLRLMEERKAFNAKVAAKTQGSRYMDMTFRLSLNDALSKYRSMFDVAARFVYLAAKAYDYETNLSDRDPASPKPLLADIMRQRTLGQFKDGQYIVGLGGLGDILARLNANFGVLKTQMGLNNPQSETSRFSVRYELLRIKNDTTQNDAWRKELQKAKTDNLWSVPEFKKFCRPFIAESAGAQPGIVIAFTSNIISGKNFFGWPLGGGDHAYDPSNFATKVRSVGIWFEGYDNSKLAQTPRAYLIPAGMDYMLVPDSTNLDAREWTIVDQKIPVPLPIGESDLASLSWFPSLDSIDGPMVKIRKYSSSRAYIDSGYISADQMNYDSRLIGRSVWNSRWLLIIPGASFHYDPKYGVDTFINTVTDIKMFFQTYAISGN